MFNDSMTPDSESMGKKRIRRVTFAVLVLAWIAALAIVFFVNSNPRFGSGMQFVMTCALLGTVCLVSLLWFTIFAPIRRRLRWGITGAIVGLIALLALIFRVEEVSGGLRPRFVFRWSVTADERLEPLPRSSEQSDASVDLSIVSPDDYPRFLGALQRQSVDNVAFDTNWSDVSPQRLWRRPIGAGWSGFVAVNGYAVTQEQRGLQELVTCYELKTGEPVWASPIAARHTTTLGGAGPRATPCVDGGRVYAMGATGVFRCLDGATGDELWRHDVLQMMDVTDDAISIAWGRAGSPLIVDASVVIPVGGPRKGPRVSLIAFDKVTGREMWRAGNRQIGYASPVRANLSGRDQIVIVLEDHVVGFDTRTGDLIWEHPWPGHSNADATVSNAVPIGDSQVFLSKGYGQGSELLELSEDETGNIRPTSVWKSPTIMKTKFSNVIVDGPYIFGLDDVILECVEAATGRRIWKKGRFGYGQVLRAGTTLIVLSEAGELVAVEASHERYIEHGRFAALDGKTWNTLCLTGPYLLVRNATEATCFELSNYRHVEP